MAPLKKMNDDDILNAITDEMAREEGYPDAATLRMEHRLGQLAGKWRRTQQDSVVETYHKLFVELVERGWNPDQLTAQQSLPRDLMPTARKIKQTRR
ncbi:MAG: hypothetical protein AAF787_21930 [Chloroflexota bacterium]